MAKQSVYLETTFVSYLTARRTRDVIQVARQEITRQWWETRRDDFTLYVSQVVVREASAGHPEAAARRLGAIQELPLLAITDEVVELHCTYDPATRGGDAPDGRKVKGTLHWVSAKHAIAAQVRLYEHLFTKENPNELEEGKNFTSFINPKSLEILNGCMLEPSLAGAPPSTRYQFERLGYFCVDSKDSSPEAPVFNRTVTLRDTWAKILKAQQQKK